MTQSISIKQLEFLSKLSHTGKYLNHMGISKHFTIANKIVAPQTIQNWFFRFKNHGFNYFHSVIFEKIGLHPVFTLSQRRRNHPFKDSTWELYDPSSLHKAIFEKFLVPVNQKQAFCKYLEGQGKETFKLSSGFVFHPPFHKTLRQGRHNFSKISKKDFEQEMTRFKKYLKSVNTIHPENVLEKNPMILPVIMESRNRCISSVQMWNAMKAKLKEDIWKYADKSRGENVAIKKVQKTIRSLNDPLNHLVQQIDIEHNMLIESTIPLVFVVEYGVTQGLMDIVQQAILKSARLEVYPNTNKAIIVSYVQTCGIKSMLRIKSKHARIKRVFYQSKVIDQHRFDYPIAFDPIKKEWNVLHPPSN